MSSSDKNINYKPAIYSILFGAITISALIIFLNIYKRLTRRAFFSILSMILSKSIRNKDKKALELIINELFRSHNIKKIDFYSKIITINREKPDFQKNNNILLTQNIYYKNIYLGSLDAYVD